MSKVMGRPGMERPYKYRTRAWFNAVSQASGLKLFELEVLFADPDKQQRYANGNRPGLWNKYKKGNISPKLKDKSPNEKSLVNRVEDKFPGTKKWFTMPFWKLACYDPLDFNELKAIYLSLAPEVRNLFVTKTYKPNNKFWRIQTEPQVIYSQLVEIGTIDAATGILALIKEAELTQNQLQHQQGLTAWAKCAAKFPDDTIIGPLLDEINNYLERRYMDTVYFSSDNEQKLFKLGQQNIELIWKEHGPKKEVIPETISSTLPASPWRTFPCLAPKKRN